MSEGLSHALTGAIEALVRAAADRPLPERVAAYNVGVAALAALLPDLPPDPALAPQLLPVGEVRGNDYNPNRVASPELDLLEDSMRADGITMPCVVVREGDGWVIVDGFHRREVAMTRLGRSYLPCSVIAAPRDDRMASTIRHNRARGKHQVDLMAGLVRALLALGWDDARIGLHLGMSVEEVLRLRQLGGTAAALAAGAYSQSWGTA